MDLWHGCSNEYANKLDNNAVAAICIVRWLPQYASLPSLTEVKGKTDFEDTKRVIRMCKSKYRQHNVQKKKDE